MVIVVALRVVVKDEKMMNTDPSRAECSQTVNEVFSKI